MDLDNKDNLPSGRLQTVQYLISKDKSTARTLKLTSHVLAAFCAYALIVGLVYLFVNEMKTGIGLAVSCAVPFILVSVFRKIINAPRPYEVLPFFDEAPKNKKGQSMPSRHVFSAFVIGTSLFFVSWILGLTVLLMGVIIAVIRVLLGIHFVKDVIAGAVIGVVGGVLGMLITRAVL